MHAKRIVIKYWDLMDTNNFADAAELFSSDYICIWPQSNEKIVGKKNFIAVNENYPANGKWEFKVNSIVAEEFQVVTDVSITDGKIQARAITFHTIKGDKISKQVEYWPDEYEAPSWRKQWVKPYK